MGLPRFIHPVPNGIEYSDRGVVFKYIFSSSSSELRRLSAQIVKHAGFSVAPLSRDTVFICNRARHGQRASLIRLETPRESPRFLGSLSPMTPKPGVPNSRIFPHDASIILVGSRGGGKRTLGFIGASHLGRPLITEDHYFEQTAGVSRGAYLQRHGRDAFITRNDEVIEEMLEHHRWGAVVECGMGTLSPRAQDCLRRFCATNPVVYVHREKEQMWRALGNIDVVSLDKLFRLDLNHRSCSNLEYYNCFDPTGEPESSTGAAADLGAQPKLTHAKKDFTDFLDIVTGQSITKAWLESPFALNAVPPEHRAYSYAMRLRLSSYIEGEIDLDELEARADAVEVRAAGPTIGLEPRIAHKGNTNRSYWTHGHRMFSAPWRGSSP